MLRKKFLFIILIIFLGGNFVFAFTFHSNKKENINQEDIAAGNKLLSQVTYDEETDISFLSELLRYGEEELVLKICNRIKKLSINKTLLKVISYYENVAFIKTLVKNGTLTSIEQIPIISMNAYSELSVKELAQVGYKGNEKQFFMINSSVPDDFDEVKIETIEVDPKEYYKNHVKSLELMATYALIEKYPAMTAKLILDYTIKNGFNLNLVALLIDEGHFEAAIGICNQFPDELNSKDALAVAYAKSGNLEKALEISTQIFESTTDSNNYIYMFKIQTLVKRAILYKHANSVNKNKDKILNIENEILTIAKEHDYKDEDLLDLKKGDLICILNNQPIDTLLTEITFWGHYDQIIISFTIGHLDNISDIKSTFFWGGIKYLKNKYKDNWDWEKF